MERVNVNYTIIETVKTGTNSEIVIGHNPAAVAPYVVWNCINGNNYNTGGYCQTYRQALLIMADRIRSSYDDLPFDIT